MSAPRLRPNSHWATSPVSSSFPPPDLEVPLSNEASQDENDTESLDTVDESSMSPYPTIQPPHLNPRSTVPTNTGRPGFGGIPRTVSLSPTRSSSASAQSHHYSNNSVDSIRTSPPRIAFNRFAGAPVTGGETNKKVEMTRPLVQMSTGTRYGAALGGGSPNKWGAGTPSCPRCGKSVYFAEQVGPLTTMFPMFNRNLV
jgi:hypothetical protein